MSISRRCKWRTLASRGRRIKAGRSCRRGTSSVLVVIALPVLLGAAAAAIDLAVLTAEGQKVQNVIDNAALSGARCYASPEVAEAVVNRIVAENNAITTWQVAPATTCYGPGDDVPGYRTLVGDEHAVEVNAQADFSFFFGRLIGLTTTTVHRRAVARVTVQSNGLGDVFIFGGATNEDCDAVKVMGRANTLVGNIHTNSSMLLGGLKTVMDGDIAYVGEFTEQGAQHVMTGTAYQTDVQDYPINYTFEEFDVPPWDHIVDGDLSVSGAVVIPSGRWRVYGNVKFASSVACSDALFVVDGDFDAAAVNKVFDGVTIVAGGEIRLAGAGSYYSPFQDNLLAFSALNDSTSLTEQGISINAADCAISGICFAPDSNLSINGSREISIRVGLVAETVDLLGSESVFSGPSQDPADPDLRCDVRLVL